MSAILLSLALIAATPPAAEHGSGADSAMANTALAEKSFVLSGGAEALDAQFAAYKKAVLADVFAKLRRLLTGGQVGIITRIYSEVSEGVRPSLQKDTILAYSDCYTDRELEASLAALKTPEGASMRAKVGAIAARLAASQAERLRNFAPAFEAALRAEVEARGRVPARQRRRSEARRTAADDRHGWV